MLLDPVADGDMTFGPRENGTYYVELTGTDRDLVRVNGQVLKAFNATDAKVVAPSGVVVDPTHRYIPIFSVLSDGRITQHTYGNLTFLQLFKDTTIIDDGIGDPPITPGSDSSSSDSASDDDGIIIVDPPDGDGDGSSSSESV